MSGNKKSAREPIRRSTRAGRGTRKKTKQQLDDEASQSGKQVKIPKGNYKAMLKHLKSLNAKLNVSENDLKILHKVYYKNKNFFGRDKLYKIAKESGANMSRRAVMLWLKAQELNQIYIQTRKNKVVQPTFRLQLASHRYDP